MITQSNDNIINYILVVHLMDLKGKDIEQLYPPANPTAGITRIYILPFIFDVNNINKHI